jgi:hypothetical protein
MSTKANVEGYLMRIKETKDNLNKFNIKFYSFDIKNYIFKYKANYSAENYKKIHTKNELISFDDTIVNTKVKFERYKYGFKLSTKDKIFNLYTDNFSDYKSWIIAFSIFFKKPREKLLSNYSTFKLGDNLNKQIELNKNFDGRNIKGNKQNLIDESVEIDYETIKTENKGSTMSMNELTQLHSEYSTNNVYLSINQEIDIDDDLKIKNAIEKLNYISLYDDTELNSSDFESYSTNKNFEALKNFDTNAENFSTNFNGFSN